VPVQQEVSALLGQLRTAAGEKPLLPYVEAVGLQQLEALRQALAASGVSSLILYEPTGQYNLS
jgi:hypothetical protein